MGRKKDVKKPRRKLALRKETLKDLAPSKAKGVKGGRPTVSLVVVCSYRPTCDD